jgi:hypothetical protein
MEKAFSAVSRPKKQRHEDHPDASGALGKRASEHLRWSGSADAVRLKVEWNQLTADLAYASWESVDDFVNARFLWDKNDNMKILHVPWAKHSDAQKRRALEADASRVPASLPYGPPEQDSAVPEGSIGSLFLGNDIGTLNFLLDGSPSNS